MAFRIIKALEQEISNLSARQEESEAQNASLWNSFKGQEPYQAEGRIYLLTHRDSRSSMRAKGPTGRLGSGAEVTHDRNGKDAERKSAGSEGELAAKLLQQETWLSGQQTRMEDQGRQIQALRREVLQLREGQQILMRHLQRLSAVHESLLPALTRLNSALNGK